MNIDADGFSMVIDLRGVRRQKGWLGGYQRSREGEGEVASHISWGSLDLGHSDIGPKFISHFPLMPSHQDC